MIKNTKDKTKEKPVKKVKSWTLKKKVSCYTSSMSLLYHIKANEKMNYLKTQGKEAEASPNKSNNAESADEAMNMVSKYTIFIIYYVFNQ